MSPVMARRLLIMLEPPKRSLVSCDSLLLEMNGVMQLQSPDVTARVSIQFYLSGLHLVVKINPNLTHTGVLRSQISITIPIRIPEGSDSFRSHMQSPREKQNSRWKEDWEELELLVGFLAAFSFLGRCLFASQGKGAFGSVVKTKYKIDSRIYAGMNLFLPLASRSGTDIPLSLQKVRLKIMQSDTFAKSVPSAVSHITTSYDTTPHGSKHSSQFSYAHSEDSSTDESTTEDTNGGMTSVPDHHNASERHLPVNGGFYLNVEDVDDLSVSRSSFPSIHFERSTSAAGEEADSTSRSSGEDGDDFASLFATSHGKSKSQSQSQQLMVVIPSGKKKGKFAVPTSPAVLRMLYIQMVRVVRLWA